MNAGPTPLHATADAALLALAVVDTLMATRLLSSPVRTCDTVGAGGGAVLDDRLAAGFAATGVVRASGRAVPLSLFDFVR